MNAVAAAQLIQGNQTPNGRVETPCDDRQAVTSLHHIGDIGRLHRKFIVIRNQCQDVFLCYHAFAQFNGKTSGYPFVALPDGRSQSTVISLQLFQADPYRACEYLCINESVCHHRPEDRRRIKVNITEIVGGPVLDVQYREELSVEISRGETKCPTSIVGYNRFNVGRTGLSDSPGNASGPVIVGSQCQRPGTKH